MLLNKAFYIADADERIANNNLSDITWKNERITDPISNEMLKNLFINRKFIKIISENLFARS